MPVTNISEAKAQLSALIERVLAGEEIIIGKAGKPVARLVKFELPPEFTEVLGEQLFTDLPVTVEHAHALKGLPLLHRDPFDRMLVAQAATEGLTAVTRDPAFKDYRVPLLTA